MTWYKVDGSKIERFSSNAVGLTFLKNPTQDDFDEGAVAPWDSFLLGTKEGDFVKVGQRYLPIHLHDECVLLHMEESKENRAVEVENLICYRVDRNEMHVSQDAKGLEYCKSSTLADHDTSSFAPWGSLVWGTEKGEEFVKVGRQYLPKHLNGEPSLVKIEELKIEADMVMAVSHLRGEITNIRSESDRFKEEHHEQLQELEAHLNETTQRVGAFESCLRKLSGLVVLCKDFEARLAAHEQKQASQGELTHLNHSNLLAFEDIPEDEEDADSPNVSPKLDQKFLPEPLTFSKDGTSDTSGVDVAQMMHDIQMQFDKLESKLDNHCHNLRDVASITHAFNARYDNLEKRLGDLADNHQQQQRAVEAQQAETGLLLRQVLVDKAKQPCMQVQQVPHGEDFLGSSLKSFPDNQKQLLRSSSRSEPNSPRVLHPPQQFFSVTAPASNPRAPSPSQLDLQAPPGSRSVQLPSRGLHEGVASKILLPSGFSGSFTPRMRSTSPVRRSMCAQQPQQVTPQLLTNDSKVVPPPVKPSLTSIRSSLKAVPVTRNPVNVQATSPVVTHRGRGELGAAPLQGLKSDVVASQVVPHSATPKFVSRRATLPGTPTRQSAKISI